MAKLSLILVVLCQILTLPILGGHTQEDNPLFDLASSFLQNMGGEGGNKGLAAIGNLVGAIMKDNAKEEEEPAQKSKTKNENNFGDILSGIGGLLGGQDGKMDPAMIGSMLSLVASQMGSSKPKTKPKREKREERRQENETNKNDNNFGDILSGIGGLLGGQDGKIDPAMIGNMISLFASQTGSAKPKAKREKREQTNEINLDNIMNLASGFMQSKDAGNLMPVVMNAINSFTNTESKKKADDHKDHADFLPPFLEKMHLYWDIFINSEIGKIIWEKSGMKTVFKAFTDFNGKLSFETMLKNFENQSFRRHWIKTAAKYLTDMVVHVSKPETYRRYITTAEYMINSFLDSQGFPSSIHFNSKVPGKSATTLINYILKNNMDIDADVSEYVTPAVDYVKETLKLAEKAAHSVATRSDYAAIVDRLTDTLNLEVIEPVLRVYRAYKHSVQSPHCREHLMCLVNKQDDTKKGPGFKAGLTKLSSLVASAALSFQNGGGFWDLYNAIQNDVNCEAEYPAECSSFHEHELKVTTEIYHSEL